MFSIDERDLRDLDAADLRRLVTRLVEVAARQQGLGTSGIRAGGDDSTPDGGLDVIAEFSTLPQSGGWLPSSIIGYQVKKNRDDPVEDTLRDVSRWNTETNDRGASRSGWSLRHCHLR
jgi:hypothetical protein